MSKLVLRYGYQYKNSMHMHTYVRGSLYIQAKV